MYVCIYVQYETLSSYALVSNKFMYVCIICMSQHYNLLNKNT